MKNIPKELQSDEYNTLVALNWRRLLVMTAVDQVFQYHAGTKDVEMMEGSGRRRWNVSVGYSHGDRFVYFLGGRNTKSYDVVSWAQRFDTCNLKWQNLPDMHSPRLGSGVHQTPDKMWLYVFFGSNLSIERLNLTKLQEWNKLDIQIPKEFYQTGYLALQTSAFPGSESSNCSSTVLILGGSATQITQFDLTTFAFTPFTSSLKLSDTLFLAPIISDDKI